MVLFERKKVNRLVKSLRAGPGGRYFFSIAALCVIVRKAWSFGDVSVCLHCP